MDKRIGSVCSVELPEIVVELKVAIMAKSNEVPEDVKDGAGSLRAAHGDDVVDLKVKQFPMPGYGVVH